MEENIKKKLIAFTSQLLRQQGIRAVRMDDVAREMKMSKRTLYKVYQTKDKLVDTCLEAYAERMRNLLQLLQHSHPEPLAFLEECSKAFVQTLYRAERVFWTDIDECYRSIYDTIRKVWADELGKSLLACQAERLVVQELDVKKFSASFILLLCQGRLMDSPAAVLQDAAYYMLRGVLTEEGLAHFLPSVIEPSSACFL